MFVCIDFDGTISNTDVIDAILTRFADPQWEEVEKLWLEGKIGSQQCLDMQVKLIKAPLQEVLAFTDSISIDPTFCEFVKDLRAKGIDHAIISDGFSVFIKRILTNNGITGMRIYANGLIEQQGMLKAYFPFREPYCKAGNCKCAVAKEFCNDPPIVLIGDGGSDYCFAGKADAVFAKSKLAAYCEENNIMHHKFVSFGEISGALMRTRVIKKKSIVGEVAI